MLKTAFIALASLAAVLFIQPAYANIFGTDDRFTIEPGQDGRFAPVVYLRSDNSVCSGALISEDLVLTATHCLLTAKKNITAYVNYSKEAEAKKFEARRLRASRKFWNDGGGDREEFMKVFKAMAEEDLAADPDAAKVFKRSSPFKIPPELMRGEIKPENMEAFLKTISIPQNKDWAILRLDKPLGKKVGFYKVRPAALSDTKNIYVAGYPGDKNEMLTISPKCGVQMLLTGEDTEIFKGTLDENNLILHDCDTFKGNSGGVMLNCIGKTWESCYLIAVVTSSRRPQGYTLDPNALGYHVSFYHETMANIGISVAQFMTTIERLKSETITPPLRLQ